jgi:glycosyltransferase involved in cell wall biosynthesis
MSDAVKPLHILLFCTKFAVGGIQRHAIELGTWLRARGHKVTFAGTPGAWLDAEKDRSFVAVDTHGVSGAYHNSTMPSRLASLARSVSQLRKHLRNNPVDLIHCHESAPALVSRLATLGRPAPIVLTFHGAEANRVRQFARLADLCATHVISASRMGADQLHNLVGMRREKLSAIGYGLKPPPPADPARVAALRAELLGDKRLLATTVARLNYQKGVDVLIDVVKRASQTRDDIRFVIVGDGPMEQELRAQAKAAVGDRLVFVGRSEEPHLYLRAGDFFLLTSRWEALPFTIVEAFQVGLPAIATNCSGVPELIDDSVGRVVPIGDVETITRAVLELADDEGLRKRMGAAALERSREARFTYEGIHTQIEAVYRNVLATRAR